MEKQKVGAGVVALFIAVKEVAGAIRGAEELLKTAASVTGGWTSMTFTLGALAEFLTHGVYAFAALWVAYLLMSHQTRIVSLEGASAALGAAEAADIVRVIELAQRGRNESTNRIEALEREIQALKAVQKSSGM